MAFQKIEGDNKTHLMNGWLTTGTVVRFGPMSRKLAGKTGIIEKWGRTKYKVLVDGLTWNVPPNIITEIDPEADGLSQWQEARQTVNPKGGGQSAWLNDGVAVGDVVLFNMGLGRFDIGQVERITHQGKPFCKVMNGRSRGQVMGYQTKWYVCKLPGDRFG